MVEIMISKMMSTSPSFGMTIEFDPKTKAIRDILSGNREFKYLGNLAPRIFEGEFQLRFAKHPEDKRLIFDSYDGDVIKYDTRNDSMTLHAKNKNNGLKSKTYVTKLDQMSETAKCVYEYIKDALLFDQRGI